MRRVYEELWENLEAGKRSVLVNVLKETAQEQRLFREETLECGTGDPLAELARQAHRENALRVLDTPEGTAFAEPYVPEPRLIVLGGGHIALPLTEFAASCGFSVTVVDDRPAFANTERFPRASRVICDSFENALKSLALNRYCFVVVITRGHRHDMFCLREALRHETAYVGMIGSKNRVRTVRDALLEEGVEQALLDRVCAPIGLKIGAVTPAEIAVSILAEAILYKRTLNKEAWPELDREVLAVLRDARDVPFAVATVLDAKGSTPRGAGAKMLVWPDGRIAGSIGGGCSEGEAIQAAYEVIRTGKPSMYTVDLTGGTAEDEGMVCGGRMRLAIVRYDG